MFNVSNLSVTSVDNSNIIENTAFARLEMGGRLISTCQFSHNIKINVRTKDANDWEIHDAHAIRTNAITFLDSLKKIWVSLALLFQQDFRHR